MRGSAMSPRCEDMCARPSDPIRQNVVFRSPPVARTTAASRRRRRTATGSGAYPRDRRTGTARPSAVDGDHRVLARHVDRADRGTAPRRPARRSSQVARRGTRSAIRPRLADVMTNAVGAEPVEEQVVYRRVRQHARRRRAGPGATCVGQRHPVAPGSSTIGRGGRQQRRRRVAETSAMRRAAP